MGGTCLGNCDTLVQFWVYHPVPDGTVLRGLHCLLFLTLLLPIFDSCTQKDWIVKEPTEGKYFFTSFMFYSYDTLRFIGAVVWGLWPVCPSCFQLPPQTWSTNKQQKTGVSVSCSFLGCNTSRISSSSWIVDWCPPAEEWLRQYVSLKGIESYAKGVLGSKVCR